MAQRRMFTLAVVDTDRFNEMPVSARLLYYELGMRADDDGFVSSPKKIIKMTGCTEDDLKLLIAKGFVTFFESGVIVITAWKLHNYIAADRYHPTIYQAEYQQLTVVNNVYVRQDEADLCTPRIQLVYGTDTQVRSGQGREDIVGGTPTLYDQEVSEIVAYLNEKTGSHFRPSAKETVKCISARLKEGYSVSDCKRVIDSRVKEWEGDKLMRQYLRPITLFGTKFEGYLNAADDRAGDYASNRARRKAGYNR